MLSYTSALPWGSENQDFAAPPPGSLLHLRPQQTHQLGAPIALCSCYSQCGLHQVLPPSWGSPLMELCPSPPAPLVLLTGHVMELMSGNACRTELGGSQDSGSGRDLNHKCECLPWLISRPQLAMRWITQARRLQALVTSWCQ